MAVTTSYQFQPGFSYFDSYIIDQVAVAPYGDNYLFGGFSTDFGTFTWTSPLFNNYSYQSGTQLSLAALNGGNYVAVTQDADSVLYQIYQADGTTVSGPFDIGDTNSTNPDVAPLKNGGFVIASQDAFTLPDYDIDLNFYNSAGTLQASIAVDETFADDRDASVAVLDNGDVAVTWVRQAGSINSIYYAVYTQAGAVVKAPTLLEFDTGSLNNSRLDIVSTAGGFLIAHEDANPLTGLLGIRLQSLTAAGNSVSSTFFAPQALEVKDPSLARLSNGMVVLGWKTGFDDVSQLLIDPATLATLAQLDGVAALSGGPEIAAFGAGRFAVAAPVFDEFFTPIGTNIFDFTAQRVLTGDGANDTINAQNDLSHHLIGNGGKDKLTGGSQNDVLDGGEGNDTLDGKGGIDTMTGGKGNDIYTVDNANDKIIELANGGTDVVNSSISFTLAANVENLVLTGTAATTGTGNSGANVLTGNSAANILRGLGGADTLDGKGGADTMEGGDGSDIYFVDNVGDQVVETKSSAAGGKDTVNVGAGYGTGAVYYLGSNVENGTLTSNTSQELYGNALNNTLTAKATSVTQSLLGGGGDDILIGGSGFNVLSGGQGKDTMTGGGGVDYFLFHDLETSANRDTIKDFSQAQNDEIEFASSAFTGLASYSGGYLGANPDAFELGTAALDAEDRIIYDQSTGNLWYDADGTNAQAQILVAVLSNKPVLTEDDFFIL